MRSKTKTPPTDAKIETDGVFSRDAVSQEELTPDSITQRRPPEKGRFSLQVDRQTKSSYATYEAAERTALIIKTGHPIVRVVIYDTIECVTKVIELS